MKNLAILGILTLCIISCQPSKESHTDSDSSDESPVVVAEISQSDDNADIISSFTPREPTDDEIREFGIITAIEDAPFPRFVVSISFPERDLSVDLDMNVADVEISHELDKFIGQYATIYYELIEFHGVADIQFDGQSILGEYAPEIESSWETFKGRLQGAEHASGDLPSELRVEDESGQSIKFEFFVDDEVMKVNDKVVEIFYRTSESEAITYMELSED